MLSVLVKIFFAFLVLQMLGGLARMLRGRRRKNPPTGDEERVKTPDYDHLTRDEIEDADYEELPKE